MKHAAGPGSQAFPSTRRIRRRPEFQRVYERGERVRARLMTVIVLANDRLVSRLGIAATRKLGDSVTRNRAKRIVREIFRRAPVPPGLDIVVIPRSEMLDAEYRTIESEFGYVLRRADRSSSVHARSRPERGRGPAGSRSVERDEQRTPPGER